jgi:hypothetical protein
MGLKLRTLAAVLALLLTLVAAAGCSSGAGKSASQTPPVSTANPASSTTPSPSMSSSPATDAPARETQDRGAVEAAWSKFWSVYTTLHTIPAAQLDAAVASVSIDPTSKGMLAEYATSLTQQLTDYGYVVTHPYWQQSINGSNTAVMGDCQDQSHFGSISTVTNDKRTVGVAHDNMKGTLEKGADGVWRVELIEYLTGVPC